jgi:hypothetical protein
MVVIQSGLFHCFALDWPLLIQLALRKAYAGRLKVVHLCVKLSRAPPVI